ncbi:MULTISPECIES: divalent metal ion exporter adaptor subunit IhpB [unclassified Bradyrhizobium]|uniref:divalent metal ion exporter adaptor subunit IhpB n=1 Tax=unclassified Bradyrhizobium TaxID=2631580 RepID=UPI001BA463EA|nr:MULTISPECIES: efflux RND transporter periplasmic adaptor subunit [unclassified Bradyrhizobium]MBR1208142.1 efflux RND transporter periplasmic adaptor subunit [Bradyrhizobium sp. AUGA SZCCT0124]MBR1316449.1 efflux RND transporter periplasmic adaptor subunit [Bradyrhizobium sp. AUGA SZCCT0051]MBR1344656.1 efflux RND transporter periplasmic adaptor subunit [Bradyrhizobium sp. AUGA SZCCT0105]MBR1359470.1 efflux RND transporter periplasmic adaptor subunit [Bradyrhizobium sp. AUGA SZCCT0045]
MKAIVRYSVFILVAAALAYGGYRMLLPATSKTAPTEKAEKEEHADSVALSDAKVQAAGIELAKASSGVLRDSLLLNGIVQPNQESLVQVTPRFPGIVRDVRKRIGDVVQKGEVVAVIESNQSLTQYELKAALAGTVIDRQTTLGEFVSEQKPAFVIADLSTVWVDFSVYRRDLKRVSIGDQVFIDPADGGPAIEAKVSYLSPVGSSDTQSAIARAIVTNAEQRLRPGLFITGRLTLSAKKVGVAVKSSALQTVENRTVVFVRNGEKFDARDVEIGERDTHLVEIIFGVLEGDVYAAQNSFIVKAELAKGAGSDEH